jgi:uncharacterized integral membrane protein
VTERGRSTADSGDGAPRTVPGGEPDAVERPERRGVAPPAAGERQPVPSEGGRAAAPPQRTVERTRAGALWTAAAIGVIALIVILIFVVQNSGKVTIHFLAMDGSMPLGVALLVSALLGALLMLAIGTIRILQLRRLARRPELVDRRRRR